MILSGDIWTLPSLEEEKKIVKENEKDKKVWSKRKQRRMSSVYHTREVQKSFQNDLLGESLRKK